MSGMKTFPTKPNRVIETDASDAAVSEGDVLSVRGLGKCRLERVGNVTKKGRVWVTLQRYI